MIELPKLPRAISRDETEHGKLYYTRKQMIDFATDAVNMNKKNSRNPFEQQRSEAVNDFLRKMGL